MNKILCGDGIEFMKGMKSKSVELTLTDPPYNAKNIGPNTRTYSSGIMQLPLKDYKKFCRAWFKEARRVSKTLVFTPGIANSNYYPQPDWILCWHKPASCSFNRMGGYNAWEPIFVYGKCAKGKRLGQDYLLYNTMNFKKGPEADHPCPKPLELWKKLVDVFSNEGETVFDPMIGSGTSAIAAKHLKRNYGGLDSNPEYVRITKERLQQDLLL